MAHPTRGLDIGATSFVHDQMIAARARGVEMPIAEVMRRVLWEDLPAQDALRALLARPNKPEFHD